MDISDNPLTFSILLLLEEIEYTSVGIDEKFRLCHLLLILLSPVSWVRSMYVFYMTKQKYFFP